MSQALAMIARLLAAIPILVVAWCLDTGKFILRAAGWLRPMDVGSMAAEAMEAEAGETPAETIAKQAADRGSKLSQIQTIARAMAADRDVDTALWIGLDGKAKRWLATLDHDMLLSVAVAHPQLLADHLALKRSIQGLLRFDDESIREYKTVLEAEAELPVETDIPSKSRTQGTGIPAWHLPLTGLIC